MANTKQGIYYPDNYNSVADVPSDMKNMAESIDTELETDRGRLSTTETNIQSLQTDNTINKQNISNIKQEQTTQNANITKNTSDITEIKSKNATQDEEIANINKKDTAQDTNIETLTQRLTEKDNQIAELEDKVSDLNNNQIHGKASGEYVHIVDSAKMECSISPRGNSKQETREGYNLIDFNNPTSLSYYTSKTFEKDTLTISCTGGTWQYARYDIMNIFEKYAGQTMSFQVESYSSSNSEANSTVQLAYNDGKNNYIQLLSSNTFTIPSDISNITKAEIGIYANNTGNALSNTFTVVKPMLVLGTAKKTYEQYGVMPSLDYPSEIEAVGDNVSLFDFENATYMNESAKITHIKNPNEIIITNTNTAAMRVYIENVPVNSNKTYSLSMDIINENGITVQIGWISSNKSIITNAKNGRISKTFTNITTNFFSFYLMSAGTVILKNLKIEYGQPTTYSPYNQGSANVKVCNKNIEDNEFEFGGIDSITGELKVDKGVLRNKNFIRIKPNQKYIMRVVEYSGIKVVNTGCRYYDRNKKYLGSKYIGLLENGAKEFSITDENVAFCKFVHLNEGAEIPSNYTLKIQLEEDTETDYVEHEEQNYPVDIQEEMLEEDYFDLENGKEVHNWGKAVFDKNSDVNCVHNNGTFQFKFCTLLENADNFSKTLCNIARHWENSWEENGCFISWEGYFYLLCKENEFGFNADMTTDEAIVHLRELLVQTNIVVYYTYHSSGESKTISLELTKTQIEQLQQLAKAKTYKNITNITTDTIAVLDVDYKKDLETYQKQQDDRITAIEQLLSTTTTSAMLLDNVQTDLESEVK